MAQDLRDALEAYRRNGALLCVKEPLSWEYELAAVLWRLASGPAVLFGNICGYEVPVVGNVLNERRKLALALDLPPEDLQEHVARALQAPIPPTTVEDPPCQERVHKGAADLRTMFPVPAISEHDGGRYISAGILIARDPRTGRHNMAICRIQVKDDGSLGCYMAPTHSRGFLEEYGRRGLPMEVAVAIGSHPAVMTASQFLTPGDEMEAAGALLGEPLQVARCVSVDLPVPAGSEIVLEGTVEAAESAPEGPFGEFPGTYAPVRHGPVIRLRAVTTRSEPIFQMIVGGRHPEHLVTGAIAREAGLYNAVRAVVPTVRQVALTEGGACRFHAVVSIAKRFEGEGKLAMLAAFTNQDLVKHVTVVDDDIDVHDPREVEWAVATRMRAHEDVVMVPGVKSNPVDPASQDRTVTKLGIDATLPHDAEAGTRVRVGVPPEVMRRVAGLWDRIAPDADPGDPPAGQR